MPNVVVRTCAVMVLATALACTGYSCAYAQGLAQTYCNLGENLLEGSTFSLRNQGIPIDVARQQMNSLMDENPTFWSFMISSVGFVYRHPKAAQAALQDGRWMELCVKTVRGY